ncbi:MAG TPA: [FeFe] hydrogenase H-cluster radical SAM maturase HydE [Clostridiaceae bacterium]|nr:[FeFe] hydrogenase H-cluster radical SAM maturase HydE [Clostridiaceae bacterium]
MSVSNRHIIDQLDRQMQLTASAFTLLIETADTADRAYAAKLARRKATAVFGHKIYLRGLIEFTNYCKNNCFYCGLRRANTNLKRYRLSDTDILAAAKTAFDSGCRTIVLQGGEDPALNTSRITSLIRAIRSRWPKVAVTLSLGERPRQDYQAWFDAGADRYLLRQESAAPELYRHLHPMEMTLTDRLRCLADLKSIGYQTGAGFLVGSPGQKAGDLATDLMFMQSYQPAMAGIGPFLPQTDTPFGNEPAGDPELTLFMISILRLILPYALLPATTAIGTALPDGHNRAILAGANVVMPNFTPSQVKAQYSLYDHKREVANPTGHLANLFRDIGYHTVVDRGDYRPPPVKHDQT